MENVGVQENVRAGVRGKLWRRAEEYCVRMRALNLALRGEHTHSNVHVVCATLQNTEELVGACIV
jgi:hypothetical protein